jgi:hypothetical protein
MSVPSLSNQFYTGFVPTQIATCSLWLDGYDQNSFTFAGNIVSKWNDKSGSNYHGTSITGSPVYTASGLNGRNAIAFNGSSAITRPAGTTMNSGTTLTCFAVGIMSNTVESYGRLFSVVGVGPEDRNADSANVIGVAAGTQAVFSYRNFAPLGQASITYGTAFQACTLFNGTTQTMYVNGTAGTSASTSGNFGYTSYSVGQGSSSYWKGFIGEVIVYNSALSTQNRQTIEGYLAQKWGTTASLPAGHPGLTSNIFNISLYTPKAPIQAFPYSFTYSPLQVPGCALWLDAATSNSVTFGSATNVASWLDKSGNGRNATQATASNQPHWYDAGANGIFFDGVIGQCLNLPSLTFTSISIFMVAQATTYTFGSIFISLTAGNGIYLRSFTGAAPGPTYESFGIDYGGSNYRYAPSSAVVDTSRHLWSFTLPSSGLGTFVWDGAAGNNAGGFTFANIATTFANPSIGAFGQTPTSSPFTGYIHEILMYSNDLTTTNRQAIESYLAQKWKLTSNLPADHPNFTTPAGRPPLVTSLLGSPINVLLTQYPLYPTTLGGSITTFGGRRFHAFTTVGANSFILGADYSSRTIEYFVLGGGGGGAGYGGGGGAGGLVNSTVNLLAGVYTVTVGAGGARGGNNANGSTGSPSIVSWGVTALGGGFGARGSDSGGNGGCGGGGGFGTGGTTGSPGGGTGSQGGNGTGGRNVESSAQSGGGGGTGGNAIVPTPYGTGAVGGTGVSYYNFGFLGGGGGGARTTFAYGFAGPGGEGGGGNGGAGPGGDGVDGKGGGGGGGDDASTGGKGGSGIVIISYLL